jgi:uncharacterized membrane protein
MVVGGDYFALYFVVPVLFVVVVVVVIVLFLFCFVLFVVSRYRRRRDLISTVRTARSS